MKNKDIKYLKCVYPNYNQITVGKIYKAYKIYDFNDDNWWMIYNDYNIKKHFQENSNIDGLFINIQVEREKKLKKILNIK